MFIKFPSDVGDVFTFKKLASSDQDAPHFEKLGSSNVEHPVVSLSLFNILVLSEIDRG